MEPSLVRGKYFHDTHMHYYVTMQSVRQPLIVYEAAITGGNLDLIKWLDKMGCARRIPVKVLCPLGRIDYIKYFWYSKGHNRRQLEISLSETESLETIQFCIDHCVIIPEQSIFRAKATLLMLQQYYSAHGKLTTTTFAHAASYASLDVLYWLAMVCPVDIVALNTAAAREIWKFSFFLSMGVHNLNGTHSSGRQRRKFLAKWILFRQRQCYKMLLETVKWIITHGCPRTHCSWATSYDMLVYIKSQGFHLSIDCIQFAILRNDLMSVKYCVPRFKLFLFPNDIKLMFQNSLFYLPILQYLDENFNGKAFRGLANEALIRRQYKAFLWLMEKKYPINQVTRYLAKNCNNEDVHIWLEKTFPSFRKRLQRTLRGLKKLI